MGIKRIGFISDINPADRSGLSGTMYKVAEALTLVGYEIVYIPMNINIPFKILNKIFKFFGKIINKNILFSHTIIGSTLLSETVNESLFDNCDILLFPMNSEGLYKIKNSSQIPILYMSDATFNVMVDYYFYRLPKWNINQGNIIELNAMEKSSHLLFSSDWSAQSAIADYKQDKAKISVVEFGANIDDKDVAITEWTECIDVVHLLFLGVNWQRKGGNIAYEACKWLNNNGVKSVLHIVGIKDLDSEIKNSSFVDYVGFLNKNEPEQYGRLVSLIQKSHCLLLPTLAECSAIAFCEASAYGLPVFSHITGGVENYVKEGVNGCLLPLGSTGSDFGALIKKCIENKELQKMHIDSQKYYREHLNWRVWSEKVKQIIENKLQ